HAVHEPGEALELGPLVVGHMDRDVDVGRAFDDAHGRASTSPGPGAVRLMRGRVPSSNTLNRGGAFSVHGAGKVHLSQSPGEPDRTRRASGRGTERGRGPGPAA